MQLATSPLCYKVADKNSWIAYSDFFFRDAVCHLPQMSIPTSDIDWTSVALVVGFVTTVCSNLDRLIQNDGINRAMVRFDNVGVETAAQDSGEKNESSCLDAVSLTSTKYKRKKRIAMWTVVLAAAATIAGLTKNFEDRASQIIEHIDLFRQNEGLARSVKQNAQRSERMIAESREDATSKHDDLSATIKVDNVAMRARILELQSLVRDAAEKAAKRSELLELSSRYRAVSGVKPSELRAEKREMDEATPSGTMEALALTFLTFENAELRKQLLESIGREVALDGKYSALVNESAATFSQYNQLRGRLKDMDEFVMHLNTLTSEFKAWLVLLKSSTGSTSRERLVQDLIEAITTAQSTATYSAILGVSKAKRDAFAAPGDVRMRRL